MATELLEVELEFSKDLASKCSGLVSRLEDEAATEATECNPDKCVLLGTILSKNLRLSFRKFCNNYKNIRVYTKSKIRVSTKVKIRVSTKVPRYLGLSVKL